MAKSQQGSSTRRQAAERADQVRSAVEEAFQNASSQLTRERAQEIADELSSAADRVRDALEQIRPPTGDDVRRLVDRLSTLERRVAALEIPGRCEAGREEARGEEAGGTQARGEEARSQEDGREEDRREEAGGQALRREEDDRSPHGELRRPTMGVELESPKEFKAVMDQVFSLMSEDPDMGPKLRDANVPQRFDFDDVDMVVNVRAGTSDEDANLHWEWSDDVDWEPKVQMKMSAEVAVRYFQGKENVPVAIARRRIKTGGDVKAALALIPITKPVYAQFRALLEDRYPHLVA